jgi:cytochrome c peroxidase
VFGLREVTADPARRILLKTASGELELDYLQIENASLASQAVGPPVSALEMSCSGRTFMDLGRKLLARSQRPLKIQTVHPLDSVLGAYRNPAGRGLEPRHSYRALIRQAFHPRYWSATGHYRIAPDGTLEPAADGYTQMEINFAMFWGIAIMLYERTLISDQSEFDSRVAAGLEAVAGGCSRGGIAVPDLPDADAVERGCDIFFARQSDPQRPGANCNACHGDASLFTSAAHQAGEPFVPVTSGSEILADRGFSNIGVHPVFTDRLSGRLDPWGNPLSLARQYKTYLDSPRGVADLPVDPIISNPGETLGLSVDTCDSGVPVPCDAVPVNVDGSSKIPGLRNVALTPPYFHTGGYANLRQVLEFYNRGGDRRAFSDPGDPDVLPEEHPVSSNLELCTSGDTTGTGPLGESGYPLNETVPWNQSLDCGTNAVGLIIPLGLSDAQLDDLEAFLKTLTDPRVQCDAAPFDHPSLFIAHGHLEADAGSDGRADDIIAELPAVGATGYSAGSGLCIPNSGDLFAPGMRARLTPPGPLQ